MGNSSGNQRSFFKPPRIQVSYHFNVHSAPIILKSTDAHEVFRTIWDENTIQLYESFYILLLNTQNKVLGYHKISDGGVRGTSVDSKRVFSVALVCNATGIILAHNHPSGNLKPSRADLKLTENLIRAGEILDIFVLDHIIMTKDRYTSFSDEGLMVKP